MIPSNINDKHIIGAIHERLLCELELEFQRGASVSERKHPEARAVPDSVEFVTRQEFKPFKWNIDKL